MTKDNVYDVVIIGGGLAGLSLAIQLAAQYNVLVLEKEDYPRHKVCGEYISMESKPFLERLGLPISGMQLPVINHLQVTDSKGNILNAPLPQGGFGISRYKLDAALAALATWKGVTILKKTKADKVTYNDNVFTVNAGNESYTARVVCGTWGKRSNVDVKWQRTFIKTPNKGLDNYIGVKYHINYPWPESLIALHNFKNGYCGISRVEEGKSCLCYLTTAANLQQCDNDIKKMELQILMRNPHLKEIFSTADFLYEQPLTISQISFQKKEQVRDHVLLLGDAAGLITPLCGNGMSMAFHAAKIAYEVVNDFLQGHLTHAQMEAKYTLCWQQQFARRLLVGRFLQSRFGKEKATSFFLKTVNTLPFLKRPLIKATSGKPF